MASDCTDIDVVLRQINQRLRKLEKSDSEKTEDYIMDNLEIDYKKAAQQLRSGEALFGKDGALAPLLERILNSAIILPRAK